MLTIDRCAPIWGGAVVEFGHGVIEDDDEPDEHFAGATAPPRTNGPTCPWCGQHHTSTRVAHADGEWYCSCGSLHNASDAEWRLLAEHRKKVIERRTRQHGEEGS